MIPNLIIHSDPMRGAVNKTSEYVLVPRKPTVSMLEAADELTIPYNIYRAMIAVAPLPTSKPTTWCVTTSNLPAEYFENRDEADQWANSPGHFDAVITALYATPAPEPQPEVAAPAKLDSGELWEFFFGKLKGYVPDELTDDLFEELADHLNAHYLATPPVVEEAVKADELDGLNFLVQYRRKDDGTRWNNMAAFDRQTIAENYAKKCEGDNVPWEYRAIARSATP